ncbi:MAG: GNAT family N-acetyltransferase [Pseudomonadota bacterium]|nr:GNAT family N-acetyltransferase [Pseudomonadota bacterium]
MLRHLERRAAEAERNFQNKITERRTTFHQAAEDSIGCAPTGRLHEALNCAIDITAGEVFWREKVLPGLTSGRRLLWIARVGDKIAGRLHLDCDTPPNQSHRAEVAKLIVHPDFRRIGIALKLMETLETLARERNRTLLTLESRSGDKAGLLYQSLVYRIVITPPEYSRNPIEDKLKSTTTISIYKDI